MLYVLAGVALFQSFCYQKLAQSLQWLLICDLPDNANVAM